ncbi:alpha/beta fold hydrolase [Moraxella nasovis]|uniref:alpha/beta hydrolase n=1 Tax=Moraxella nasovis TaxID=2904121 RepID=UPI001F61C670|nr:alpha/beta fold hydrolase [Moraxella nasovis]UNU73189.1 alpha/beta fold hydrolase [Moraxella nasovis]
MKYNNEIVFIDAPMGKLEVEVIRQAGERTSQDFLAVICHQNPAGGTMNNKVVSTLFRFCRDAGMDVARFNYRGVGRSTGVSDYGDGEFVDTQTVLHWLMGQTKARNLWLGGFSFGGFVACRMADLLLNGGQGEFDFNEINLQSLALIAPSVERNDASSLNVATPNAFMIYGDQDKLVSPDVMKDFATSKDIDTTVMPEVGHFFHGKLVELKHALAEHSIIK